MLPLSQSASHDMAFDTPAAAGAGDTHGVVNPHQTAATSLQHHDSPQDEIMGLFGKYPDPSVEEDIAPAGQPVKNILDTILAEHREIRGMLTDYQSCNSKSHKLYLIDQLVHLVSQHASCEERTIYAFIKTKLGSHPRGSALSDRMNMDCIINKHLLHWLDLHKPVCDDEWLMYDETFDKFAMVEKEHLLEEEEQVLDILRPLISPTEMDALTHAWAVAKTNAPVKPHLYGPTGAVDASIFHPVAVAYKRVINAGSKALQSIPAPFESSDFFPRNSSSSNTPASPHAGLALPASVPVGAQKPALLEPGTGLAGAAAVGGGILGAVSTAAHVLYDKAVHTIADLGEALEETAHQVQESAAFQHAAHSAKATTQQVGKVVMQKAGEGKVVVGEAAGKAGGIAADKASQVAASGAAAAQQVGAVAKEKASDAGVAVGHAASAARAVAAEKAIQAADVMNHAAQSAKTTLADAAADTGKLLKNKTADAAAAVQHTAHAVYVKSADLAAQTGDAMASGAKHTADVATIAAHDSHVKASTNVISAASQAANTTATAAAHAKDAVVGAAVGVATASAQKAQTLYHQTAAAAANTAAAAGQKVQTVHHDTAVAAGGAAIGMVERAEHAAADVYAATTEAMHGMSDAMRSSYQGAVDAAARAAHSAYTNLGAVADAAGEVIDPLSEEKGATKGHLHTL